VYLKVLIFKGVEDDKKDVAALTKYFSEWIFTNKRNVSLNSCRN
jgi:hypothetical protein